MQTGHNSKKQAGQKKEDIFVFAQKYIHNVQTLYKDSKKEFFVKARCYRSMRKNEQPHHVMICLSASSSTKRITDTTCSCAADNRKAIGCSHCIALIYTLADYCKLGLNKVPVSRSCTSKPQEWNRPKGKAIPAVPVMDITCQTPKLGRDGRGLMCNLYDTQV